MDKKSLDAAAEHVSQVLATEQPAYNADALARQQEMLSNAAREAGYTEQEIEAGKQALARYYQERTTP